MVDIDFRKVFKEIKEQYSEYINSPKIFGSIVQNNPSIIIKKDNDKWIKKIYNFAFGGVYISVRIHNVIYTIEMQNESQIKSFLLSEYEDDTLKKTKRSISATPKYKKHPLIASAYGSSHGSFLIMGSTLFMCLVYEKTILHTNIAIFRNRAKCFCNI